MEVFETRFQKFRERRISKKVNTVNLGCSSHSFVRCFGRIKQCDGEETVYCSYKGLGLSKQMLSVVNN